MTHPDQASEFPAPIRVLVVDDSALVRRMARETLDADPEIKVVGTAADPYEARDRIVELRPDVLTLDLEMPRMDGLTFLQRLMERRPMPVVVMSSLTSRGSDFALEALRLGAVDVIGKPAGSFTAGSVGPELAAKVKAAARARFRPRATHRPVAPPPAARLGECPARALILLGSSTGGVEANWEIFTGLSGNLPPIALVQHIPPLFSRKFAERLAEIGPIRVREATDRMPLEPGTAVVAPGNQHLLVQWTGVRHIARVVDGPPVWHQRPAVDLLFRSAVDAGSAAHCVAGVLTGMGRDGAEGLRRLREGGAVTFAQDEASSVVYGMPRAAFENNAAQIVLPLSQVASFIIRSTNGVPTPRPTPAAAP